MQILSNLSFFVLQLFFQSEQKRREFFLVILNLNSIIKSIYNIKLIFFNSFMNCPHKIFRSLAFNPLKHLSTKIAVSDEDQLQQLGQENIKIISKDVLDWAKSHGVTHYTFWIQPQTVQGIEKHEAFFQLEYSFSEFQEVNKVDKFTSKILQKGQGDGSSIPNGGIRGTERARAYIAWDSKSDMFIREGTNKTLYIPAMMLTHHGQALDEKTYFRRAEKLLKTSTIRLLEKLGETDVKNIMFSLGIQQQFFVIKKSDYNERIDMKMTGRALYGALPPRNQQFSQHYYGKVNDQIFEILCQAQNMLLALGVPIKTKHKQVAINQYQISSYFQDAIISTDHNLLTMEILQSVFEKHGYMAIFHEKPFKGANGSGKHCNWSLSFNKNGKYQNLFEPGHNPSQNHKFLLFILMTLRAVQNNSGLFKASVTSASNEHRMGGHQAPPSIMSVFLGQYVNHALNCFENDIKFEKEILDLGDKIPGLKSFLQDNTDRNRTCPFAFTGNKFQFRAVGGKQNVSFPMTVVAACLSNQIKEVIEQLQKGSKIEDVLKRLVRQTKMIRFQGDGYSKQWEKEAKNRGLPNLKTALQSYVNIRDSKILTQLQIFNEKQLKSKFNILIEHYDKTKITEANCLILLMNQIFLPRILNHLLQLSKLTKSKNKIFQTQYKKYENYYQTIAHYVQFLETTKQEIFNDETLESRSAKIQQLKIKIDEISKYLSEVQYLLPRDKTQPPQLYDIFNNY